MNEVIEIVFPCALFYRFLIGQIEQLGAAPRLRCPGRHFIVMRNSESDDVSLSIHTATSRWGTISEREMLPESTLEPRTTTLTLWPNQVLVKLLSSLFSVLCAWIYKSRIWRVVKGWSSVWYLFFFAWKGVRCPHSCVTLGRCYAKQYMQHIWTDIYPETHMSEVVWWDLTIYCGLHLVS